MAAPGDYGFSGDGANGNGHLAFQKGVQKPTSGQEGWSKEDREELEELLSRSSSPGNGFSGDRDGAYGNPDPVVKERVQTPTSGQEDTSREEGIHVEWTLEDIQEALKSPPSGQEDTSGDWLSGSPFVLSTFGLEEALKSPPSGQEDTSCDWLSGSPFSLSTIAPSPLQLSDGSAPSQVPHHPRPPRPQNPTAAVSEARPHAAPSTSRVDGFHGGRLPGNPRPPSSSAPSHFATLHTPYRFPNLSAPDNAFRIAGDPQSRFSAAPTALGSEFPRAPPQRDQGYFGLGGGDVGLGGTGYFPPRVGTMGHMTGTEFLMPRVGGNLSGGSGNHGQMGGESSRMGGGMVDLVIPMPQFQRPPPPLWLPLPRLDPVIGHGYGPIDWGSGSMLGQGYEPMGWGGGAIGTGGRRGLPPLPRPPATASVTYSGLTLGQGYGPIDWGSRSMPGQGYEPMGWGGDAIGTGGRRGLPPLPRPPATASVPHSGLTLGQGYDQMGRGRGILESNNGTGLPPPAAQPYSGSMPVQGYDPMGSGRGIPINSGMGVPQPLPAPLPPEQPVRHPSPRRRLFHGAEWGDEPTDAARGPRPRTN